MSSEGEAYSATLRALEVLRSRAASLLYRLYRDEPSGPQVVALREVLDQIHAARRAGWEDAVQELFPPFDWSTRRWSCSVCGWTFDRKPVRGGPRVPTRIYPRHHTMGAKPGPNCPGSSFPADPIDRDGTGSTTTLRRNLGRSSSRGGPT